MVSREVKCILLSLFDASKVSAFSLSISAPNLACDDLDATRDTPARFRTPPTAFHPFRA